MPPKLQSNLTIYLSSSPPPVIEVYVPCNFVEILLPFNLKLIFLPDTLTSSACKTLCTELPVSNLATKGPKGLKGVKAGDKKTLDIKTFIHPVPTIGAAGLVTHYRVFSSNRNTPNL